MKRNLKLYVWEGDDVLDDHTNGMICVLAHDLEEALKLIVSKYPHFDGFFPVSKYKEIDRPEAFGVQGGD